MSDLISRQDAIDLLRKWADGYSWIEILTESAVEYFDDLPAAELKQKKGRWIGYEWKCSACGFVVEDEEPTWNFCPNCGADMRGENNG